MMIVSTELKVINFNIYYYVNIIINKIILLLLLTLLATVKALRGNVATAAKSWFENAVNTFQNSGKSEVDSSPTDLKVEEIQQNISALERLIQSIHKSSENLVKRSREVSTALFDFGQSTTWLGQSEGNDFGTVISRVGTAVSDISVTATQNAETEAIELEEPLDEYVRLMNSVKNAIKHRQNKKENYREALTDLEVKQAAYNKLKVTGKTDQLESKRQQVDTSQTNVEKIKKEYEDISDKFLVEYNNFMETTAVEIKQILFNYAKMQLEYNKKLEKSWGELLPVVASKN
jgi:prefoldin subunit 5